MRYIFYQTKTKFTNTGDALINHALIDELRNYGTIVANSSSDIPGDFLIELGIKDKERLSRKNAFGFAILKYAIKSLFLHDEIFLVSGLGDCHGGNVKSALKNFFATFWLFVLKIFRVHTVRIGRSFGKLTSLMEFSETLRSIFIDDYYVRDTFSLAYCQKMNIKKAKLCPDFSWLYDFKPRRSLNNSCYVMINCKQPTDVDVDGEHRKEFIRKINCILRAIQENQRNAIVVVVAFQVEEDEGFSKDIAKQLSMQYQVIWGGVD